MNEVLKLSGKKFSQESRRVGGRLSISVKDTININKLKELKNELLEIQDFWKKNKVIKSVLISVYYKTLVPKSKRIRGMLTRGNPNDYIVGVKYNDSIDKNIITYNVSREDLEETLINLDNSIKIFQEYFSKKTINKKEFDDSKKFKSIDYKKYHMSMTNFKSYLRDSCYIDKLGIERASNPNKNENLVVTFYDVHEHIENILLKFGIDIAKENILNNTSVLLNDNEVNKVYSEIPYLVSMSVEDFSKLSNYDVLDLDIEDKVNYEIPLPSNEPTIGVIDTLFDKNVYFSDWVEYHDEISNDIEKEQCDYDHGTAVTSLIVDAPNLNPSLEDGCGRFKVRHFGVSLRRGFNSFTIIKKIEEVVKQNLDIKVWNLSLGSEKEINKSYISLEASILDQIQNEYDVIFVIAGTNLGRDIQNKNKKIGAPADSINSLVVNSVNFDNDRAADYSRRGPVLSFFQKPDVSYYGGDENHKIRVCMPSKGLANVQGTSFAAPLVARKLSYLIDVLGFNREEAKALIIDSATSWKNDPLLNKVGYGVVPKRIEDIINVEDDELRFVVSGISRKYNTYNYSFPIPLEQKGYPYKARVTMCYFPKCSRNQGVDYSNTELNVRFGRTTQKGIKDISGDNQYEENISVNLPEKKVRNVFQKWNNTKQKKQKISSRSRDTKIMNEENTNWGLEIKTAERLHYGDGKNLAFGIVITLKNIHGENRNEEFIRNLELIGWTVNRVNIKNKVKLYNSINTDIKFDN